MIQYHIYPGGKRRVVTFSYDDGHANDRPLINLFNRYGVKGTFHLNGINYREKSARELQEIGKLYEGHEISCHTYHHGWPSRMPRQSLVREITEDRRILEEIAGYPVVGMSYPSGSYSAEAEDVLRDCGILYSRTVRNTGDFLLPENFLEWHPSCHHKQALKLCKPFLDCLDSQWTFPLFYIWGHSFEFATDDDWSYMESVLKEISGNPKIWYATNIEIYNYMMAQRALQISYDETVFYNPSAISVWVEKDKERVFEIPAGKTVRLM